MDEKIKGKYLNKYLILIIALFVNVVFVLPVLASTTNGTIDASLRYAWSENMGWLDFGTSNGNVTISDSVLTGYAYSENAGWISLNCSNEDSCATVDFKISNDGEGNLSGYAYGENIGWINFNPTEGGVTIDSDGNFGGYAYGENIGWIVFSCSETSSCSTVDYGMKTDWRPASSRNNGSIGFAPIVYSKPKPPGSTLDNPTGKFKILINNDNDSTSDRKVSIKLFAGTNVAKMAISNTPDFKMETGIIPFQSIYEWDLCYLQDVCSKGQHTLYAKFFTQYGQSSDAVSDVIMLSTGSVKKTLVAQLTATIYQIQLQIIDLIQQLILALQEENL